MLTFTSVGEKANTVELCNPYKICWTLSGPVCKHPSQLGVGSGGRAALHLAAGVYAPVLITRENLHLRLCPLHTPQAFSSSKAACGFRASEGLGYPNQSRHMAWCYWQLTSLFLLHYHFLFCCCEAFFF